VSQPQAAASAAAAAAGVTAIDVAAPAPALAAVAAVPMEIESERGRERQRRVLPTPTRATTRSGTRLAAVAPAPLSAQEEELAAATSSGTSEISVGKRRGRPRSSVTSEVHVGLARARGRPRKDEAAPAVTTSNVSGHFQGDAIQLSTLVSVVMDSAIFRIGATNAIHIFTFSQQFYPDISTAPILKSLRTTKIPSLIESISCYAMSHEKNCALNEK
jgi:hypothetical protein